MTQHIRGTKESVTLEVPGPLFGPSNRTISPTWLLPV
jgi:hypothetical protein